MDAFYRSVLGLKPEPSLAENRETTQGYAGKVSFVTDGQTQAHLAEKDLGVAFRTNQPSIRLSAVISRSARTTSTTSRGGAPASPATCSTSAAFSRRPKRLRWSSVTCAWPAQVARNWVGR